MLLLVVVVVVSGGGAVVVVVVVSLAVADVIVDVVTVGVEFGYHS